MIRRGSPLTPGGPPPAAALTRALPPARRAGAAWNCSVAELNLNHALAPPLTTADWHGWYGAPGQIDGWSCPSESELVITTRESYYPLLQELSFIRPLRFMSPAMFVGGLGSDPLTQNSCPTGWGVIEGEGVTVTCAGTVGGGASGGGPVSGTGRWRYAGTDRDAEGAIESVTFALNGDRWDAPSGDRVEELVVVAYPDDEAVKAALLSGELDAVLGAGVLADSDVAELRRDHQDEVAVLLTESIQNRIVVLNTARAPTDDLQTRKAIIHAIDKKRIVEEELAGLAEPVYSLFPKDAPYSNADLTPVPAYDIEKARMINCPEPREC